MADRRFELGRAMLLAQLEYMKSSDRVWADDDDAAEIAAAIDGIDTLCLPEEYTPALAAYWREFVEDPGGTTNPDGPFDRDDPYAGINEKLWSFFDPLTDELAARHHRRPAEFILVIDVDLESDTKVVILWGDKLLMFEWCKPRWPRFRKPTLYAVLEELGELYERLAASLRRASGSA